MAAPCSVSASGQRISRRRGEGWWLTSDGQWTSFKLPALNRQGAIEPPVVRQMRKVLLAAKRRADTGELTS